MNRTFGVPLRRPGKNVPLWNTSLYPNHLDTGVTVLLEKTELISRLLFFRFKSLYFIWCIWGKINLKNEKIWTLNPLLEFDVLQFALCTIDCLQTLTFILSPANMLNTDKVIVKLFNRTMKCLVKGIEPCSEYKFSCFY